MATQNFTATQVWGTPNEILLTDTSTDLNVAVVKRRVTITDKDNTGIVESGTTTTYEEWNDYPATTTLTLAVLDSDKAVDVKVDWLNTSNTVLYTKTIRYCFSLYAKQFYVGLIKSQSSNDKLKSFGNYYQNLIKLLVSIKEAEDSITLLDDISSSQAALNRAKKLIDSPYNFY